jgi:signal transduction histidine kinase/ActR/RegA family two-component response regulator
MKINLKILVINFSILLIILGGSGFAFYSIMYNVLTSLQSKNLLNSTNDIIFTFENDLQTSDASFQTFLNSHNSGLTVEKPTKVYKDLDYVLKIGKGKSDHPELFLIKSTLSLPLGNFTLQEFFIANPYLIVRLYKTRSGEEYLYGFNVDSDYLMGLNARGHAGIALFLDRNLVAFTNENANQKYIYNIGQAFNTLSWKNNYEIFSVETEYSYFLSTIHRIKETISDNKKLTLIVFTTINETGSLRSNLKDIFEILGAASAVISLILTYVFTSKFRKQINNLTTATRKVKSGNFNDRINIISADELSELGLAFNIMLDELEKQEVAKNEYTEFLALVNQSQDIKTIADDCLQRIKHSTDFIIGAIYLVKDNKLDEVSSIGMESGTEISKVANSLLEQAIRNKTKVEYNSGTSKVVTTGEFSSSQLAEILIMPIIIEDIVIALLQLGAKCTVDQDSKEYIEKIKTQLAVGFTKVLAYKRLEQLVRELELQKSKAVEATELKSKFLATISHELRTPLNSILGLTDLLVADKSLSPKNLERLAVMTKSGKRLLKLINEILDLTKLEFGKMEITNEVFSLKEFVQEISNSVAPLCIKNNLEYFVTIKPEDDVLITTDKNKLYQILLNLLGNAIKFTSAGSVILNIVHNEVNEIIFEIQDTGIGIDEKEKALIFEEFIQADNNTSHRYVGSGLGLSIAKKFTELLHGKLSLESEKGKGSSFFVQMPVGIAKIYGEKADTMPCIELPVFDTDFNWLKKPEILIVDDDPDSLFTINEIVESMNCSTILAKNGKECIEVLEKCVPDVILLDIMMPIMDGFKTIKVIRSMKKFVSTPVFAVTARAMVEERNIIYKYGFNSFIPKPIDSKYLINSLRQWLQKDKTLHA